MKPPRFGPGAVVAAALIGPGTVTTCLRAGVDFRYALLWALTLATLGTIILQEMSARLGVAGGVGLGEAIRRRFDRRRHPAQHWLAVILIVAAVGLGNAAYQTGNLLGAAGGLQLLGGGSAPLWGLGIALAASAVLWTGSYAVIERALVGMVAVMAIVFLVTAAAVAQEPTALIGGALVPHVPQDGALVALALVGTIIVPYNLFLHASAAHERWRHARDLPLPRFDLVTAITLGGLVAMAIVVTGAGRRGAVVGSPAEMATLLEPLLGSWAKAFFALGLLAAGMASAITAPMAAAYALSGVLGWVPDLRSPLLRTVWLAVMATGLAFTLAGFPPAPAILLAQAANGILLPAVATFLLMVMNDTRLLKGAANGWFANALGGGVVVMTLALGAVAIWRLVGARG